MTNNKLYVPVSAEHLVSTLKKMKTYLLCLLNARLSQLTSLYIMKIIDIYVHEESNFEECGHRYFC